MRSDVMSEVERHFRPEFLNRIDELIIFNPLNEEDLKRIIHLQLKEVMERVAQRGLKLELQAQALAFLMIKGFNEDFGARPMRRAIDRYVEDPLAEQLLRADFDTSKPIVVTVEGDVKAAEALKFVQQESTLGEPAQPVAAVVSAPDADGGGQAPAEPPAS
jgi:ATP-dependent Clp protease ATP-binding subunit ClpC